LSRKQDNGNGIDRLRTLTSSIGSRLNSAESENAPPTDAPAGPVGFSELPLDNIRAEGVNVRTYFDEEALAQLASSMERHGLLQPVVVAPEPGEDNRWRLIAGERRFRAAKQLGWTQIPVRILPLAPDTWKAAMMTENTLREDFTLGEELEGYAMLREEFGSTEAVADLLGLSASYMYSLLRIWRNPRAREAIEDGTIQSKAVARVLSSLVTNDGKDRKLGVMEKALAFCADKHPSKARLKAYVDELMHDVPEGRATEMRTSKLRYSFLSQEEQRVNRVVSEVLPALSPVELRELKQMYQAVVTRIEAEAPELRDF